ncbi:MAG: phosphotransferase [Clostridium sp.]
MELFNKIYAKVKSNFQDLYYKLPRQAIHRDMHGENIIFKDEKIVGYIDFDLSQINARIYDICYLCTGSLSTIFNDIDKRDNWIGFAENVIKGYDSISNLTDEERHSIKYMFYLIELIMVAYFSQNNCSDIANMNIKMINWISLVWNNYKVQ